MKPFIAGILLTSGLMLFCGPLEAKVYKWVDENGVGRFSDTPPPGVIDGASPEIAHSHEDRNEQAGAGTRSNVTCDLSGEVRDAQGNLINGVIMTIIENHPRPDTIGFKQIHKEQTVNGRFHIACSGCPIHRLRFRAPGHLFEEYTIKATESEEQRLQRQFVAIAYGVDSPEALDPITIRRNDIVIVLQPKDSIVRLTRISAQLMTIAAAPFTVVAGLPSAPKETPYTDALKKKAGAGKTGTPYGMLALSTGDMPFGYFESAGKKNLLHTVDTALYLELKDLDGGFVPAAPVAETFRKRFDAMTEAPASGYRTQLPVSPTDPDGMFFYCKFGSVYGIGQVVPPAYMTIRGNGLLRTQVLIYLNPTGSRNLKSRM